MIPGTYDFTIYEGETWAETWTRSGVTTATGWSARLDIRATKDELSELYLSLTSAAGITLSSNGVILSLAIVLTLAQTAALQQAVETDGNKNAYYDLKLTKPDTTVEYLLRGKISLTARITP